MAAKRRADSLCMRLQKVSAAAKQQRNFDEYTESLYAFLWAIKWPQAEIPPFFTSPLGYFYYKKRPAGVVSFSPFPFGNHLTYKISSRTFPSFLRCLGLPEGPTKERNALLFTLKKLLQQYPYNARDKLMKDIILALPNDVAHFLHSNVYITSEKNLFYQTTKPHTSPFTFLPLLLKNDPHFHKSLVKSYLSEIIHNPTEREACSQWPHLYPSKSMLFYNGLSFPTFQSLSWEDGFLCKDEPMQQYPVKALAYMKPPAQLPSIAAAWLFHLTGGCAALAEQFAKCLAAAVSPRPDGKNISVLYTRENASALIGLFTQVFGSLLCGPHGKASMPLPSLNQLCRPGNLIRLYIEQGLGKGVVLVRDQAISDTAKPVLKKLIAGKRIPISHPHIPKQNLFNRIHIICISQDRAKAQKISQELKTEVIDFSGFELPVTNLGELSKNDVAWLRTVFLPHGLAERTQPAKQEKSQRSSDGVEEFLRDWCTVCKGNLCDRASVYAAYCACYRHTHPGLQPPLTMGRFVKQMKKWIGKGALSNVTYRKVRAQQRMFFDGLVCPSELPSPVSVPNPSVRDSFSEYLLEINEDAPSMFLSQGLPEPR